MPRKPLILAAVIVALHLCEAATLGTTPFGSLLANLLEIAACGFAVSMAVGAHRRGQGMSRPFWLLVGAGIAMWGVANLGWMYYEVVLHSEPPSTSIVRFLFGLEIVLIATALFLDQDKDSPRIDAESVLDFIQIGIVFFFIYVEYYYLPIHRLDSQSAFLREMRIENVEDVFLTTLAGFQALRARKRRTRNLYGGLALYLLFLSVCAALAQYQQSVNPTPTGTMRDLFWTGPFLVFAIWAAKWQPSPAEETGSRLQRKTLGELMVTNATFALAPLIILWQVSQMGGEWRPLRFSLLGISILCYAARLGISQYREGKSANAVLTHTMAMDSAINGMAILDAGGKFVYVNSAYARMIGNTTRESMQGKSWREVSDPQNVTSVELEIREALKRHGKWFGPMTLHHPGGKSVRAEMAVTTLPDGGTICVSHDITDRVSDQQARAETEIKYRTLIEQVAAISYIAELGTSGQWLYVSPQIETILGYSPDEWLEDSSNWLGHVPVEDHPIVISAEDRSSRGEPFQAEYRMTRKNGEIVWVSDTAVVVRGSDSHPVMEGLIVDITDRKMLEEQLQQARKMEAVGRLAGGVAHDFNNLLTIIKGYVEMALHRCLDRPELHSDIRRVEEAADRAVALVRQLLAFSRKQVLRPKILDLNTIVLNLDQLLRRLMSENIEMKTLVSNGVGAIKADPGQIEQVIMNLVVNARDALPNGGRILIETSTVDLDSTYTRDHAVVVPGPYVLLAVSDTGIGMTPDTVGHIFEPFYTTKESGRGTGLGLSTVYGIVKQSGGYIWVYSELGKGTTFKVYLPRVTDAVPASDVPMVIPASTTRKGKETILLVEDEPDLRELTQMVLSDRGYTVISAHSPTEAEELAGKNGTEIHLLLTDVVMPGISGRELARRLTGRFPNLRVMYMSGYTYNVIAEDGTLEEGMSFLQKPFTPQALSEKVREALDRPVHAK
ncbi:MAG TPA: PAS domain S-box protein [Candidatus Acidoferrum sp.]|nr:PAS domain S-box protein [Candidatus Acidoferrum sp.]